MFFSQQWLCKYSISIHQIKKEIVGGFQPFKPIHPKIPDRLCTIIKVCLSPDKENRFRSFVELVKAYKSNINLKSMNLNEESSLMVDSLKAYIKEKTKLSVMQTSRLIALVVVVILSIFGVNQLFLSYMKAIPEIAVPDLSGLTEEEVEALLDKYQLNYLNAGVRFHPNVAENFIIETKPPAGRIVKEDRVIRLYLSKRKRAYFSSRPYWVYQTRY